MTTATGVEQATSSFDARFLCINSAYSNAKTSYDANANVDVYSKQLLSLNTIAKSLTDFRMSTTTHKQRTYLALGDSMSIDQYTGVKGGGAVSQFYRMLGDSWKLDDRSSDMNRMRYVPTDAHGDVITVTIGGNDLIADLQRYLDEGPESFAQEHLALLQSIRQTNPGAIFIVGNVYAPQSPLPELMLRSLDAANDAIADNIQAAGALLADIRGSFQGNEREYLCYDIEPSHKGATVIASLFYDAYRSV